MGTSTDSEREAIEKHLAQRNQQARPKARAGGCLANTAKVIVVLILGLAFAAGFDYVDAPWSWGVFGQPTLTGEWVGSFRLPEGQLGAAYLNLTHDHNATHDVRGASYIHNLPPFNGTAQGCIGTAEVQTYSLDGGATANGQDVEMTLRAQKPTIPNFALHELKGTWNGDTLTLAGTVTTILDTKGSTMLKSEPNQTQPTAIVFRKGGQADFEKACQTLGQ
jgi:hypothetical protein